MLKLAFGCALQADVDAHAHGNGDEDVHVHGNEDAHAHGNHDEHVLVHEEGRTALASPTVCSALERGKRA